MVMSQTQTRPRRSSRKHPPRPKPKGSGYGPPPCAPANGRPGFPFAFWFSGCWRALAKGTAWAGFYCLILLLLCTASTLHRAPVGSAGKKCFRTPGNVKNGPFCSGRRLENNNPSELRKRGEEEEEKGEKEEGEKTRGGNPKWPYNQHTDH